MKVNWPELTDELNPCPDAVQTVIPAAVQRGRSPENAAARVLPIGFAADLPTTFSYNPVDSAELFTVHLDGL